MVSNDNVATFIKELVLEPVDAASVMTYQPGDYLQLNIPAYDEIQFREITVKPPFAKVWEEQHVFDFKSRNEVPIRRNYSFATNPAVDKQFRFNVRIATPPRGQDCHAGGGSGMAPLRSHISHLLETQKITRKISFWHGARSLQEVFYREYFEDLAKRFPNFSYHLALSEPQPEDNWTSHTGFIHEVLQREHLDRHPSPGAVEYYLCGPPVMIQSAIQMLKDLDVSPKQIAFDEF